MKFMRKKDFILIAIILLVAVILGGIYYAMPEKTQAQLQIMVDGKKHGIYPLNQNRTIEIKDTNICIIQDGKVTMKEANCPDHLCMSQRAIDSRGGTIVCLPNKVVLEIIEAQGEEVPDAVAS